MKLSKKDLRAKILAEIAALPDDYIAASDSGIYANVTSQKEFADARNIMVYHSVNREPDTLKIMQTAFSMGKTVALPQCLKNGIMHARAVGSLDELVPAVLGIPAPTEASRLVEPYELDLIIVPAIAYNRAGYRLGYGGGYYDRYLAMTAAFKLGLARERMIQDELPIEPHDIAVDAVATELGVTRYN